MGFEKKGGRRRIGRWIAAAAAAAVLATAGWMHLGARTVHVRRAEVSMADLPASFDGTKLLFVTDLDLCGVNTVAAADKLFADLQALEPDLLLLGGDYVSASLMESLNGTKAAAKSSEREALFKAIAKFDAPLGKLAVSGENDGDRGSLAVAMAAGGVKLIDGSVEVISNGYEAFAVTGVTGSDISATAARFSTDQCVLALMHSPDHVIDARIAEAGGGGSWADLLLAGHTHGGQINLFGRTMLSLTEVEERYLAGWYTDGAAPLLVSQGVGCEGANFRLGSQGEIWLITLKKK